MEKSEERSSSDSKRVPDLSLDVISEILCKLPIDSVLRCRWVCKAWCCLTKSPTFIEQLLSSNVSKPPGLILEPTCADNESTKPFLWVDTDGCRIRQIHIDPLKGLIAMSTCRGLLCVGSPDALDPVFVCNPITREYRELPTSEEKVSGGHKVGLGFDPSTGRYKVLRTYINVEDRYCFEVTTLGASSWRRLDVPDCLQSTIVWEPTFWNGAIHWQTIVEGADCIMSFDVCHEKFRLISLPQDVYDFGTRPRPTDVGHRKLELLGFRGCLTIVEHDKERMRLWEVTGNKFEDLSICFWDEHDTYVAWNAFMTYKVIGRLSPECYLLQITACYGDFQNEKVHFKQFLPKRANYLPLDIPGLPPMFTTIRGYEPSLVSPEMCV